MSLATFFNSGSGGNVGGGGAGGSGGGGPHQLNTIGAYRISQSGSAAAVAAAAADPNMSVSAAAYAAAAAATAVHFSGSGAFGLENSTDYDEWLFGLNDTLNDSQIIPNTTFYPFESPLPLWSTVILGAMAGICSLVTVLGNAMVLFSFAIERTIRQPTNYFIASLAVSDLLIGAFSMPFFTSYILLGKWPMGPWLCDLWLSLDWTVCLASQYTVFLITMDRFFSVKLPAKYRNWRTERKVIVMIATTWVVPISVFFTCIIGWQFFVGERTVKETECEVQFMSDPIFLLLLTIGYYWTTLIVMCGLYTGIYRVALTLQRKSEAKHKKIHAAMEMAADHRRNANSVGTAYNDEVGVGADAVANKDGKKGTGMTTTSFSSKRSSEKEEERSSSPAFASDDENSSQSPKPCKKPSPKDLPQLLCEIGKVPAGLIEKPPASALKPKAKTNDQHHHSQHHGKKSKLTLRASSKSSQKKGNRVENFNSKTSPAASMAIIPMARKSTTNAVVTVYEPAEIVANQSASTSSSVIEKTRSTIALVPNECSKFVEDDVCCDQPLGMSAAENMRLLSSPPLVPLPLPPPMPSSHLVVPATPIEDSEEEEEEKEEEKEEEENVVSGNLTDEIIEISGGECEVIEETKKLEVVRDEEEQQEEEDEEESEVKSDRGEQLGEYGEVVTMTDHQLSASTANEIGSSESLSPVWKRRSLAKSSEPSSPSSMHGSRITVTDQEAQLDGEAKTPEGPGVGEKEEGKDKDEGEEKEEQEEKEQQIEQQKLQVEEDDDEDEADAGDTDGATASLLQPCASEPTLTGSDDTPTKINATRSVSGSGTGSGQVSGLGSAHNRLLTDQIRPFGNSTKLDMAAVAAAAVAAASGKEFPPKVSNEARQEQQLFNSKNNDDISSLTPKRNLKHNSPFQTIVRSLNKPKARRRSKKEKTKSKSENRARKALRTITFILGAFVLCWTPYHLMVAIIGLCGNSNCVNITLYQITYWLCYLNSPINPFCYAFANVQFKRTFLRILRLDWHRT